MGRLLGVLQTLGAVRQRDGGLVLELAPLELTSLFGGALVGTAHCGVQGDALAFKTPPELAACGRLWLPDITDDDALVAAIADAHGELRSRINDAFGTLRRLGFKARLQAPEPRARGFVVVDGAEVMVAIDTSGDLVVESVDGLPVGNDVRRSLVAPEEATAAEALSLVHDVVRASQRAAPNAVMSQEEFAELQAALSDDDDDDFGLDSDDEIEPTAAGVPVPTRRPEPSSFEDSGTLQVPMLALQQHTVERRFSDDDSDIGTRKVQAPHAAPPPQMSMEERPRRNDVATVAPMTREASLLDEFDDDEPPPPVSRVDVDIDLDFDSGEGDRFDAPEPTATRPVSTPRRAPQPPGIDSEESDLLAALGDDDSAEAAPVSEDDGDDSNDRSGDGFGPRSTAITANSSLPSLSVGALPSRVPSPAQRFAMASIDSTSAQPVAVTRQEQPQVTDDDFDDGKTRALVVDEALLARLKLGDAQEAATALPQAPVAPAAPATADLVVPQRAENDLASMLDDEPVDDAGFDDAGFDDAGFDDDDFGAASVNAPAERSTSAQRFDSGLRDLDDAGAEPNPFAASSTLALPADPVAAFDDELAEHAADVHDARLLALSERERELLAELSAVQRELAALRASMPARAPRSSSGPAVERSSSSPSPVASRSVASQPAVDHFAVVGASDDGAPEWDTNAAAASLPSMASIDVHEVGRAHADDGFSSGHSSILDAFDDDAPAVGGEQDDDVVSLAALQGALKEMGVDLGDGNATQVAAAIPFPLPADAGDDGDVFGSGMGSVLPRRVERTPPPVASVASELSVEATRVRQARPAAIGLVVEDERARQRLRKYLVDRFAELFEAEDATAAMQQRAFGDVDAIVFIRPSDTERTNRGFSHLESMARRPRVLVISTDERFDDFSAVDLRLPLAQKASEVARQVLDGLERLGVQTSTL